MRTRREIPEWWLYALAGWGARAAVEAWAEEPWDMAFIIPGWIALNVTILWGLRNWALNRWRPLGYRATCPDCWTVFTSFMAAEQHIHQEECPGAPVGLTRGEVRVQGLTAWFERTWYSQWFDRDPMGAWLALVAFICAPIGVAAVGSSVGGTVIGVAAGSVTVAVASAGLLIFRRFGRA
jgi:hypothetical protein